MGFDSETIGYLKSQIQAHRRRISLQRYRQAIFGSAQTEPNILIDIQDGIADICRLKAQLRGAGLTIDDSPIEDLASGTLPPLDSDVYLQTAPLWREAFLAIHKQNWSLAECLLIRIARAYPDDKDAQAKLNDVRRLHKCQENYLALVELCDDEQWETAQAAMRNFDKSCPDWPDSENLRNLITAHLHRQALVKIADEARRRADWGSIRRVSHDLSEIDLGDPLAFSLLREAQLADEEDERNRRDRIGHARIHATAGNFQRCLELLKSNFVNSPVDILTAKALVELVDNLNIPLIWRLRAAKILGTTKDPRLPITSTEWQNELEQTNNKFGEPQSYWSFVRAGKYLIGGWQFGQSSAAVPLSAFWIGRYPITNAQFKYFVDTRSRKLDWRVWQKSYYSKSKGFEQLKSSPSNEPVHLASWHDATLFAGWLNLQIQGILHEDYIIRLPTEAEWEAAAAFDASGKRRSFPWGDELPSIDRVAYKESQLSGPNPVGIYPNQAACGAYDMAGNVWECTTSLSEKYPAGSHLSCYQFTDNDAISWRGGDTDSNDDQLLCSYRSEWCMFENMSGGFRLVIAKK